MALIKECRCGKIIDYKLKYCNDCESKVKDNKRSNDKHYDMNLRNKNSKAIYNSTQWDKLTQQCKYRFKGLDIYSYYVLGVIEYGNICHHIEEVTLNENRRYDLNNLVYLTNKNHNIIHGLYRTDYKGTTDLLFYLVSRWVEEM
jgi:hypothetical protein